MFGSRTVRQTLVKGLGGVEAGLGVGMELMLVKGKGEQMFESRAMILWTSWSTQRALRQVMRICHTTSVVHILDASVAIRSKISLTNEFKMAIALFEIPVSGWTCLRTS